MESRSRYQKYGCKDDPATPKERPRFILLSKLQKRVVITSRNPIFERVRDAGFYDAQILEMVSLSVQFLLTNLINNVAETDGDAFSDDDVQGPTVVVDAD